jgi:hypothetical protein
MTRKRHDLTAVTRAARPAPGGDTFLTRTVEAAVRTALEARADARRRESFAPDQYSAGALRRAASRDTR